MITNHPLAAPLGWAILHSLWQGAAAAMVMALVLAATRTPRIRYLAACAALLTMIAGFAVVFASHFAPAGPAIPIPVAETLARVTFRGDGALEPSWPSQVAPWLAPFWLAGAMFLQIRNAAGLLLAYRLRRFGVLAVAPEWQQRLGGLCRRMNIGKPVAMLESSLVDSPAVIGQWKPLILIPIGLLANMPAHQIEAILLHELAHIRRNDYLVNLCLRVIEGILFYHPATWWLSHIIRNEREHCCDDAAVASSGGSAYDYVSALTALEHHRRFAAGHPGLAATGGNLMTRIQRLLSAPKPAKISKKPSSVTATLLLAAGAITAYAWPQGQQVQTPWEKWLNEDVVYIIEAPERAAYQRLTTDDERKMFTEQFWLRRDPTPGTKKNERQEEHYRRIAYSNDRFKPKSTATLQGWKTDRGKMYIVFGPPDEIESHPSGKDGKPPYEQWRYRRIEGRGDNVIMSFIDVKRNGEYEMESDPRNKR